MNLKYWLRNLPHRARGAKQELFHVAGINIRTSLAFVKFTACEKDATGRVLLDPLGIPLAFNQRLDYGLVSRRVITNAGVAALASAFCNTIEPEIFNYHDVGTGNTAESASQTALVTPFGGSRVAGTQSNPGSTNIYQTQATISFTGSFALVEHAVFSASTSGTMLDRSVFSAINVVNGDSLQGTYQLTLPSGG